jgi:hypothetical protein
VLNVLFRRGVGELLETGDLRLVDGVFVLGRVEDFDSSWLDGAFNEGFLGHA